jgi:hypothetical protein
MTTVEFLALRDVLYLGDGVYIGINDYVPGEPNHGGQIVVGTTDGVTMTNVVYFEPETWANLRRWQDSRFGSKL